MTVLPKTQPARNDSALRLVRRLLAEHGRAHAGAYAFAFVLMGVSAAATAGAVALLRPVVNGMMDIGSPDSGGFRQLRLLAFAVGGLFLLRGFTTFGQLVVLSRTGNRIIATIQARLYRHVLAQPIAFYGDRQSSEIVARLALAANGVRDIVQLLVTSAGRDIVTLIGLVAVMVYDDPLMALLAFSGMPIGAFLFGRVIRRIRKFARRSFDGSTRIMQTMQETAQGIRIIKSFNLEEVMQARMNQSIREVEKAANRMATGVALSSPISETLGGIVIALILLYGSWRVAVAHADPGSFFSFIMAMVAAYEPSKRLSKLNLDLQNGLVNARLIYDVLDEPLPSTARRGGPALQVGSGRITFENVRFGYRPDATVLDGLSFTAEPDKTTALVGPSGGGKSTIISLIQRFYDPDAGSIRIDGTVIDSVDIASLRSAIAFVSQDVFLFRGSIRENIALGRPGADQSEIIAAARQAHAHDFIMSMPDGYDTNVGEYGSKLSGGQKQRVAIARAFLKQASIILLDEPTAALDAEAEREVQKALTELRQGRTTVVVAHRLQTIIDADRICVVENGRAAESGTHEELMRLRGSYHTFFATQFGERARRIA
jgi:ATP-binding cassette, subfamily B, bacterial MsbA